MYIEENECSSEREKEREENLAFLFVLFVLVVTFLLLDERAKR